MTYVATRQCRKRAYPSEATALGMIRRLDRDDPRGGKRYPYLCHCGNFHVTREEQRGTRCTTSL